MLNPVQTNNSGRLQEDYLMTEREREASAL
jgi:hypothetical protein